VGECVCGEYSPRQMDELVLTVVLGVVAAVVAVFVIQAWPSRYGWGDVVSLGRGVPTGRPIYAVRFGRKLPDGRAARGLSALLNQLRLKGPIDITFHARVVIDIGTGKEKAVPIPVEKPWRPAVSGGILVFLLPNQCELTQLRPFPAHIQRTHREGRLSLDDLLALENSCLRLYAYCYRRYMGTRFVKYRPYMRDDIKAGSHEEGRFVPAPNGVPPLVSDLPSPSPSRIFQLGGIRIEISRAALGRSWP
jgi:hypothetical protein